MTRYAIGLGSNVGDRLRHLVEAVAEIEELFGAVTASPLYETVPVGGPEQASYLNAVVLIETGSGPVAVLDALHRIERLHERTREIRWGPRTLDLDIITSDGPPLETDRLIIPHPRAEEREFVLRPLIEVWPEAPLSDGITVAEALSRVGGQGVSRLAEDWVPVDGE